MRGRATPADRLEALIAQVSRDPRPARRVLAGLTVEVVGDAAVVAWLGLFVGRAGQKAA